MTIDLSVFSSHELKAVFQELRELLSQKRLAFLIGAGCSKCAGLKLMSELTHSVLECGELSGESRGILEAVAAGFEGAAEPSIEDYMSELVDQLSIAQRRGQCGAENADVLIGEKPWSTEELRTALVEIKAAIAESLSPESVDLASHQRFVRAIHGALAAGREARGVDYFVLNYDCLIEDALGIERVAYVDGFMGAATGWWEPESLVTDGSVSRVLKVHGSIDWRLLEEDFFPRRVRKGIVPEMDDDHVLIYPAATKYKEAQRDPFARLIGHMRESLRPEAGTERVLAIMGYGFGDSHIDLEVENALRESTGRLTVLALVAQDAPEGTLAGWLKDPEIADQVRVYTNRGFHHGGESREFDFDLPWWRFEVLARLLGGER